MKQYNFRNDYFNEFNIIKSDLFPKKVIHNYYAYTSFINEFNNFKDQEMHQSVFMYYYGFKKIKTEDFYNHFKGLHAELITKNVEELILEDIE